MGQNINDKDLIKETYAASLQPERLAAFEDFWEAYLDLRLNKKDVQKIDEGFLQSHFSMALSIVERIRHEREEEDYFHRLVMSHPGMAFIIDKAGRLVASNPDADQYLENKMTLHHFPIEESNCEEILLWIQNQRDIKSKNRNPYAFKDVSWGNGTQTTLLLAVINPSKSYSDLTKNHEQYCLISRIDLEVSDAVLPIIQERYGLTSAEAKVGMYLANGKSVKEISSFRATSEQTGRTQIKNILSKTQSRDIAQLVNLFLSLGGKFQSATSQAARFEKIQSDQNLTRIYNVILPDGRYMEYVEQGHPKGKPVLQMHSVTSGVRLTDGAAKKAVLGGWRFITPSRAGYGNSDPNPRKTPQDNVKCAATDFRDLLDHLKLDKVHIMSGWAGCFSQYFANKFDKRVIGILQTGCVPVWHIDHLKYMKPRHRIILKTSLYAPAAAPYMLRLAKALTDGGKGHLFVKEIETDSHVDLDVLRNNTHLLDTIASGHEHNLKQGTQAFINDLKTIHTNWIDESRKLQVPITVLRGGLNQDQPVSAFTKYEAAVPHAKMKVIEDAGTYLYLTHFDRVLEELGLLGQG